MKEHSNFIKLRVNIQIGPWECETLIVKSLRDKNKIKFSHWKFKKYKKFIQSVNVNEVAYMTFDLAMWHYLYANR